jgi:2-methylcitrate dehydratase PrpD
MNPRHYERGWHCTATLGPIGAAAAASRLLDLDRDGASRALAIAASEASGLKENFGTMVKPLHAGLAARNGIVAALLAREGLTASARAIDGPQGMLAAMDGKERSIHDEGDLGMRWEILESGITVKLYPSCAATHPTLDAILDLRRHDAFTAGDVERIEIDVDSLAPGVLIYDRPATGLEAKFSMPFCAAAAVVFGGVEIETFDPERLNDAAVRALMPRVVVRVDRALDQAGPPLTHSRVTIARNDGRRLSRSADGARGYPERPASDEELSSKFLSCAKRTLSDAAAHRALGMLRQIEAADDVRKVTGALQRSATS